MIRATTLALHCPDCPRGTALVTAYQDSDVPGLAVNEMHTHGRGENLFAGSWVITHVPSGLVISNAAAFSDADKADDEQPRRVAGLGRARAEHAVTLLGRLPLDWTVPSRHPSMNDPTMRRLIVAVCEDTTEWQHGADHLIVDQTP